MIFVFIYAAQQITCYADIKNIEYLLLKIYT